jgi:hypothetical protein
MGSESLLGEVVSYFFVEAREESLGKLVTREPLLSTEVGVSLSYEGPRCGINFGIAHFCPIVAGV